jgi:3-oxoacyl-[acyl-carrier-protein] synthase II
MQTPVVITGLGIEVPGINDAAELWEPGAGSFAPAEFTPADKLGRQGLRYKDRATKLALCAGQSALRDAGLPVSAAEQISSETFGVVVSSNLGNVDTVCRVVDTVRTEGADCTSPLDMPNLSSNVIASSIAIRFGCKAVNLMVCSGGTSGIDALYLAANAIRCRRALRILVVGVEPANEIVSKLMTASANGSSLGTLPRIGDGSAAVVLEDAEAASERRTIRYAEVGAYSYHALNDVLQTILGANDGSDDLPDLWLTPSSPDRSAAEIKHALGLWGDAPPTRLDLNGMLGETYGALGIFQCLAACLWLKRHPGGKAIATSGGYWGDGTASILLRGTDHP